MTGTTGWGQTPPPPPHPAQEGAPAMTATTVGLNPHHGS